MSLRIGCTGGIGAGKSTVTALLAAKGAATIDADELARAALAPGSATADRVLAELGEAVRAPDGGLDRLALARLVFADARARRALERIVHPIVHARVEVWLAEHAGDPVVVVDSPLLVETASRHRYRLDGLLVVDAPEDIALDRLIGLRGMDEADARARIAAEMDRFERLQSADFVIMNMGTSDELVEMVEEAWRWIESLAAARAGER